MGYNNLVLKWWRDQVDKASGWRVDLTQVRHYAAASTPTDTHTHKEGEGEGERRWGKAEHKKLLHKLLSIVHYANNSTDIQNQLSIIVKKSHSGQFTLHKLILMVILRVGWMGCRHSPPESSSGWLQRLGFLEHVVFSWFEFSPVPFPVPREKASSLELPSVPLWVQCHPDE